jgi:hypothetical protein
MVEGVTAPKELDCVPQPFNEHKDAHEYTTGRAHRCYVATPYTAAEA